MATELPFDGLAALHEGQHVEADQPDMPDDPKTKLTEARRRQGGRKGHGVELDHLPGTRPIPYRLLSHGTKLARGRSMAAAAERRGKRRALCGILLHLDQRAYKRAGAERREAFDQSKPHLAYLTGRAWDFNADFFWLNDDADAAQHLDHLFTSATRTVRPRQTFRQYLMEQQS